MQSPKHKAPVLHLLGTGGYYPSSFRETSSYMINTGKEILLFDCGSGLRKLPDIFNQQKIDSDIPIHVFLSHYHLDHSIGLTWLPSILSSNEITVHYPTSPCVETEGEIGLSALTHHPLFALSYTDYPKNFSFCQLDGSSSVDVGSHTVKVLAQKHAGGSIGFRLDDLFAYITDTDTTNSNEHHRFLRNVRVAVIDAMYDMHDYEIQTEEGKRADHGSNIGVAQIALDAGVEDLGLVHLHPRYSKKRLDQMFIDARNVMGKCFLGTDGQEIRLDD